MNRPPENRLVSAAAAGDETLRLIAHVPVPEGLEERVRGTLRAAQRSGRVLVWPAALRVTGGWLRAAAAAAIVFVVAGGGWGVYLHVQHQAAKVAAPAAPQIVAPAGGFSSAGTMRKPQTVKGPAVTPSEKTAKTRRGKKTAGRAVTPKAVGARAAGK